MLRKTAEKKINELTKRLDARITEPDVIIELVYLFGSMLTDKERPGDIDIAVRYKRSQEHIQYFGMGWAGAINALKRLRKLAHGMKKISIHEAAEIEKAKYPARILWKNDSNRQ